MPPTDLYFFFIRLYSFMQSVHHDCSPSGVVEFGWYSLAGFTFPHLLHVFVISSIAIYLAPAI